MRCKKLVIEMQQFGLILKIKNSCEVCFSAQEIGKRAF